MSSTNFQIRNGLSVGTGGTILTSSGSNIGIGTTNPSSALQVVGDINYTGSLLNNGSPFTGSQWKIGAGNSLYYSSTFVGVGTSTPSTQLEVSGTVTATNFSGSGSSLTSIPNSALNNSSVTINTGNGLSGGGIVSLGNSLTLVSTGVTTISTSGIGINATNSGGSVTISSGATSTNTSNTIVSRDSLGNFSANVITATLAGTSTKVSNTLTFANTGLGVSPNSTFDGSAAVTISYNTIGSPKADGTNATGTWPISISGNAGTATTSSFSSLASQVSNALTFNNSGSGSGSGSTFNGSGALTISYNTIGAASTNGTNATGTWPISISGTAGNATTLVTPRTIWGQSFNGGANVSGDLTSVGNITGTGSINLIATSANLNLSATGANNITFNTNALERFRLDSSGNIGLGTTVSSYRLTVTSNSSTPTASLTGCMIDVTNNINSYGQVNIRNTNNGSTASADLIVTADNGTDTTNFVDFGINNSGFSVGSWTINGANDGYLYASDGNLSIGTASNKYLSFFTGGTLASNERLRIDTNGNIGVGGTSPSAWNSVWPTIQIQGGSISGSTTFSEFVGVGANFVVTGTGYPLGVPDVKFIKSGYASAYRQIFGSHAWYTSPFGGAGTTVSFNQALTLDVNGNLGIGTGNNPSQKLHVVGNSYVTGARYDSNNTGGTSGQVLSSTGTGTSWTTVSLSNATLTFGTYLTGTSYNGSSPVTIGIAATSLNTANNIVVRDASGNFTAGTITANLTGTATTATTATNATNAAITSVNANLTYYPVCSPGASGNQSLTSSSLLTYNPFSGAFAASTISDSLGNVRNVPINNQTSAYILAASDVGKCVSITTGGVTIPANVFSPGNAVTIVNNSGSNQTITQGTGCTVYYAGVGTSGNRVLLTRGFCNVFCYAANQFIIAGAGVS